jgi:plastocyanin
MGKVTLLFAGWGAIAGGISGFLPQAQSEFALLVAIFLFYVSYKLLTSNKVAPIVLKIPPEEFPGGKRKIVTTGIWSFFIMWLILWIAVYSSTVGLKQPTGAPSPVGVRGFTVEGSEFSFSPTSIAVNRGDRIRITFKNVGSVGHNFVIGDLNVSTAVIQPGDSATVEFTANTSGTFAFWCSVPGHREAGMEGQLIVS